MHQLEMFESVPNINNNQKARIDIDYAEIDPFIAFDEAMRSRLRDEIWRNPSSTGLVCHRSYCAVFWNGDAHCYEYVFNLFSGWFSRLYYDMNSLIRTMFNAGNEKDWGIIRWNEFVIGKPVRLNQPPEDKSLWRNDVPMPSPSTTDNFYSWEDDGYLYIVYQMNLQWRWSVNRDNTWDFGFSATKKQAIEQAQMKTTRDLVYEAVQPFTSSARQTEIGTILSKRMYEPVAQVGIYCLHKDENKLVIEIGTTPNEGMPMVKIAL